MKRPTKLRPSQGGKFASPVVGRLTPPATGDARYRCFVCGDVTINNRRYAVCAECDDQHGIRDKWAEDYGEIEARHERQRSERQAAEGLQMQGGEERASKRTRRTRRERTTKPTLQMPFSAPC